MGLLFAWFGRAKLKATNKLLILSISFLFVGLVFITLFSNIHPSNQNNEKIIHEKKWGIYVLDLETSSVKLVYSSAYKISRIRLDNSGDDLIFSQQIDVSNMCIVEGSPINLCEEICSVSVEGNNFRRITHNNFWDLVPNWSTDDSEIFFLSFRETLDIFKMDANGENLVEIYDSGFHDSDLHSSNGKLVFTRNSQIWMISQDGTDLAQVTNPLRAGEWGDAVLPFGDYDPNLSPNGNKIVFERLVDDETTHGNYEIFLINIDGSDETVITDTGYTQGLPIWSHSAEEIVYLVGAIGNDAKYDIYLMKSDGSNNRNITPEFFPADFLCHDPIFSVDDTQIYFVGEWYND